MKTHHALSDQEFQEAFEQATLDPVLFTHEAHIRLAWILIREFGVERAAELVCEQIAAFDAKYGDGTKFHVTITVAAVKMVHHFMERTPSDSFAEFIQLQPRLKNNFKALLSAHYSSNVFSDEAAKNTYLKPDLLPF